jgi:hypothetical protein
MSTRELLLSLMLGEKNYSQAAQEHEVIFRNILKDMKKNQSNRPAAGYIPKDFDIELPIEDFYKKYSAGNRYGIFSITNFGVSNEGMAGIAFGDVACMSGGGASWMYTVAEDKTVTYVPGAGSSFRS